jgi:hypothetical protein
MYCYVANKYTSGRIDRRCRMLACHSGRCVWGVGLGNLGAEHEFESRLSYACLCSSFCIALCCYYILQVKNECVRALKIVKKVKVKQSR